MFSTGATQFGFGIGGLHSLFSEEIASNIALEKIKSIEINEYCSLIIWHAPVIEIRDEVHNDEFCSIIDMSSSDIGRDSGEGFAIIRSKKVGYEFKRGDEYNPNSIRFFHK